MKKLLCLILAAALLLALGACAKSSKATYNDAGYYEVFSIDDGEDVLTKADFDDLDWTIYLQLNEDGTGVLDMDDGDVTELTWQDGSVTYDGETTSYVLAGGMLTLDLSDSDGTFTMIFKKGTPPAAEAAEEKTGGLAGRFGKGGSAKASAGPVGTYKIIAITGSSEDDSLDEESLQAMEELGLTIRLYISEDGTGVLDMYGEAMDLTWTDTEITVDGESIAYTYEDGKLTISEEGESLVFEKISDEVDLSAVGSAPAFPEDDDDEPKNSETAAAAPAGDFEPVGFDFDDYHVEVVGAEPFTDSDGKDAVRFYYDFTNNSDKLVSAWTLYYEAEEDGYELVSTYASYEDDVPEYGNDSLKVEPGVTIRCIDEFSFHPDGSELIFTISDYDDEFSVTFDPQALPGRPGDWEPEPIDDPQLYLDYLSEGSTEDAYIAITSAEIVEQDRFWGDTPVLRVFFDYTNYEDDTSYITDELSIVALQDGIELESSYAEEELDSDDIWWDDVAPGESSSPTRCWALRTNSPIEVVVTDWWSDEVIAAGTFYPEA